MKFLSRKFLLTIFMMVFVSVLPFAHKAYGISEAVTLTVLAILAGMGVSYGFINVKDSKFYEAAMRVKEKTITNEVTKTEVATLEMKQ